MRKTFYSTGTHCKKVAWNFSFVILLIIGATGSSFSQIYSFRINQVGYLPDDPKRAFLLADQPLLGSIIVKTSGDGREMFRVKPKSLPASEWIPFSYSYVIEFSVLRKAGQYHLEVEGTSTRSQEFSVGKYPPYQNDVIGFMRSQRCGFNPHTGLPCHTKDGRTFFGPMKDSTIVDVTGGWHDAGDQLKYLITSSNATARILQAYQWAPDKFSSDEMNALGQAGSNGTPDALDEARWGLDWIMKMHPAAGQLFHQVADDRDHRGFKLPHEDNADYGWGKNSYRPAYFANGKPQGVGKYPSEATGIANVAGRSAAALALGFQVWSKLPDGKSYASLCLNAATDLYEMGKRQEGYQQGNSFGAPYRYMEDTWADDMEWAAAELYKATKKQDYLDDAVRYAKIINTHLWMELDTASHYQMYPYNNLGHYTLWEIGSPEIKRLVAGYYEHNLLAVRKRAMKNPYLAGQLFIWCSNNLAASVVTQVILYEKMTGDLQFHDLMIAHRDWLFGFNPWGTSMITGIPSGGDFPLDVHMPFWKLGKKVIPGSLVDGPLWESIHSKMIGIKGSDPDEYASFQPAHLKYMDDFADYSTNEPTMDGSADMLLFLAYFSQ